MLLRLVCLLAVGLLLGADDPKPAAEKAADNPLKGTWKAETVEQGGTKLSGDELGNLELTFDDSKYAEKRDGEVVEEGEYTLDLKKAPKTIDLKIGTGEHKGKPQVGIFEVKGDTVRMCLSLPGSDQRPKEFSGAGEQILVVFKKVKK